MNYWTQDEKLGYHSIEIIKNIAGENLRWSSYSDGTKYPYIKVYNSGDGQATVNNLKEFGIDSFLDCYEADDGDDEYGKPIMLKFWSVVIRKNSL